LHILLAPLPLSLFQLNLTVQLNLIKFLAFLY
jgi:hypothetical protein